MAELSDLAEACLQACYEHALIILPFEIPPSTKFFILGLGKLGARELNFYSDIDLIYVYDAPFQPPPRSYIGLLLSLQRPSQNSFRILVMEKRSLK
ncbi:Glutamate-ammonia-ligase adenylyltransferase [Candidatus Methanoperedenaceae archaeon GB50]|nr:Glutamate-ammonia-ligase adenylyltransferase [Candidatus Methanoperedenaceae archaeon GB50]